MKKLLILSIVLLAGCTNPSAINETSEPTQIPESEQEAMNQDRVLDFSIVLTNVSEGEAEGYGNYGTMENETKLFASFDVVDPGPDFFYEGWLVCDGKPYTTNALELNDGRYENIFVSTEVPTDCQKYVLTIEPDDNDPAPADHVMDGVFEDITSREDSIKWNDPRFEI